MEVTAAHWVVFAACAFIVALAKTGIPGVGILAVVMLLFVLPAKESVGFLLPMLIMGDVFAVAYYRRHAVWSHLFRLMPWAAVGIVAGYFALGKVNEADLRRIIGGIVLVLLAVEWWWSRRRGDEAPNHWWIAAVIGVLAGVTTMLANAAGPLVIIYFLAMRFDKTRFIGTSAWYFLLLNCFKVPFLCSLGLITWHSLAVNVMLLPAVAAGALVGVRVLYRIPQKWFVIVVKSLAAAAAIWLFVSDAVIAALRSAK